jgi:hypothetical protein
MRAIEVCKGLDKAHIFFYYNPLLDLILIPWIGHGEGNYKCYNDA